MNNKHKLNFNSALLLKCKMIAVYVIIGMIFTLTSYSQTPGLIYKPAGSALGRSVLDPNGDGYVSLSTAGFSGTDYGAASELNMVSLPIVGVEPTGDLTTGAAGGHTDIVNDGSSSNQSCYLLYKETDGVNYLIIRFRIGSASTSSKGYSFLLDTDGVFGSLLTAGNPGFDKEVVLETGNSGRIAVYDHSAAGTTLRTSFTLDNYHQRSVALSTEVGNADYFYDFFIPFSALGLSSEPVRISAVTVTSAGSGITGSKSDYNGINDQLYGNDPIAIAKALINTFPSTSLTALTEGFTYPAVKTTIPVVNGGITSASTSISGTSGEANGTTITVYKNGVSIGTTTVNNNSWTLTGVSGLAAGNLITAAATATGKTISDVSASVEVTGVQTCYNAPPVIVSRTTNQTITGTWSGAITPNGSNIRIRLYNQADPSNINEIATGVTVYVQADGTWSYVTGLAQNDFNGYNILATATIVSTGCLSAYSNVSKKTSGNVTTNGLVTPTPTITTASVFASTGSRSITVANNGSGAVAALLKIYVNGVLKETTASTVAINGTYTFALTGLLEGDIITARAQATIASPPYWLSNESNQLTVQASASQTNAPIISGTYTAGSSKTVTGTSDEAAGTTITLYQNGVQIGTTTVTAFGTWSITGLTLTSGQSLTAKAKAVGELISAASNAITVASSAPSAPVVTGSYQSGATSVSGTGASGTVTVYVDGSEVGSVTATGAWTLSGIESGQLYKGGVITAVNTVSGISSASSNSVTITGVSSFKITNTTDGTIGTQVAGVAFNVKFTAMDALNGTGNTVTGFTGKVVVSSTSVALNGTGQSTSFSAGILNPHALNLTTAGSNKVVTVVSVDDPTAVGTATIAVIEPNTLYKLVLNAPDNFAPGNRAAYTVTRKDAYDNVITTGTTNVYLTVNSSNASFKDAASNGNTITTLSIGSSQSAVNFWMATVVGGLYTVTASDANPADGNIGLIDATDEVLVGTIWTGNSSTNWATGSNWEGNTVPASGDDIVIPTGRPNYPILDQSRTIGSIFMGENATTSLNNYTLSVQGSFLGTGKFIGSTGAAINLTGTGIAGTLYFDQNNPGTSNKLATFTMNRSTSGELLLGTDLNVTNLVLTNGKLDIADFTITTTNNNGGGSTTYVKTSGTGVLQTNITNGATVAFPVGNSTFNPVSIMNNTGSADDFSVQVLDEVYQNGNGRNGNATTLTSARIKRTWEINKSTGNANSGSGINMIFDWNGDEEISSISNHALYHFTGNRWREETEGTKEKVSGQRRFSFSGYKGTFSPFTILESNAMLPVRWKGVAAEKKDKSVVIKWATLTEQLTDKFIVQHSVNGKEWKNIGSVKAAGNSILTKQYDWMHFMPEIGINYYRIQQIDLDGKYEYSAIVKLMINNTEIGMKILGNPVANGRLQLSVGAQQEVKLFSLDGKPMYQGLLQAGTNEIDVTAWPKGIYLLKSSTEVKKLIVQ